MKKQLSSTAALMTMLTLGASMQEKKNYVKENPEPIDLNKIAQEKLEKEAELMKSKGLTLFRYDGGSLWALNQKSADKKAIKLDWI